MKPCATLSFNNNLFAYIFLSKKKKKKRKNEKKRKDGAKGFRS